MSALTCAVTGANGFAGKSIVRKLQAAGCRVIALLRNPETAPSPETRRFVLGELLAQEILAGVDVLVHAAYDFSLHNWPDICRINAVGSDYLFDAAARAGVRRQIFISSMSAFEGCRSEYGCGKLAAENAVAVRGGISIRPGMLYSNENGGLAARIATAGRTLPIVPMIGNGRYPLYTCHVDDLASLVLYVARADELPDGIITAGHPQPVTLLDIIKSTSGNKWRLIIMTPPSWISAGLWVLERLRLRPAFRRDSVRSLVHANPAPDFSALEKIPVSFRPFEGMS
jgi:NADH dehydrogenase